MFRIERNLVQVSSPAEIPLISVGQIKEPGPAPKIKALPPTEKSPQDIRRAADNLLNEAKREAEARLKTAEEKAAAMLTAATQEAEAMLAGAQGQTQSITEEARQRGYEEGRQEGLSLYQKQTEEAGEQLGRLLLEITEARENLFSGFEGEMVDLAVSVAEKIVMTTIEKDGDAFKAMIINALRHMRREGNISLRVSEQQYNEFFNAESANFALGTDTISVSVVNDQHLKNGDLILESAEETVNAGVSSQLKHILLAFGRPGGGD